MVLLSLLLELVYKLLSSLVTEYWFHWLCTDYIDSLIEFIQAYITIIDLVRNHRNPTRAA